MRMASVLAWQVGQRVGLVVRVRQVRQGRWMGMVCPVGVGWGGGGEGQVGVGVGC